MHSKLIAIITVCSITSCKDKFWNDIPTAPICAVGGGDAWKTRVEHAADDWRLAFAYAGCSVIPFRMAENECHEVALIPSNEWYDRVAVGRAYQDTFGDRGRIEVSDGLEQSTEHSILLHEFGHAIGLVHNENIHSLMYPTVYADAIRNSDIAMAINELGCK